MAVLRCSVWTFLEKRGVYPILFEWQGFRLYSHTAATFSALVVVVALAVRKNRRSPEPLRIHWTGGLWLLLCGKVGAHLYWVVQYGSVNQFLGLEWIHKSGQVFYGGLLGGIAGALIYCYIRKIPYIKFIDLIVPYVALGEAIVRIGCFLGGCCWGARTDLPWGVCYPKAYRGAYAEQLRVGLIHWYADHSLPVHPVQLYFSLVILLIVIALVLLQRSRHFTGEISLAYLALYGMARFFLEYFRADCPIHPPFHWTLSQTVALCVGTCASVIWAITYRTTMCSPSAEREMPGNGTDSTPDCSRREC